MNIVPLDVDDVPSFVAHMRRHSLENGRDGDPIFMPFGREQPYDLDDATERRRGIWSAPLESAEWGRAWGLRVQSEGMPAPRLGGHIELEGCFPPTAHHRVNMGMGIERPWRGRGQGVALLHTAIEWARAQPFIRWVDLGVFAGNAPASALYRRAGFSEIGRMPERFLVDGDAVEDISMTLFVGPKEERPRAPG